MYRQSPSRNQRSKGIKVKNVLQVCLLLAACFWLLYQVKHSHDKKTGFDETDAKTSLQKTSSDELIRLGRKDIRPQVDKMDSENEIHDETSEEEETTEEGEEYKHGEDDPGDKKVEERDDDEAGDREDEMEEHEQEKLDAEVHKEQSLIDGGEREDGEDNEIQETDSESHDQTEKESTSDDTDHDAKDMSAHEAREEHYKADDASSAVTHDTQIATENENEHVENSNEHPGNILEEETKENNSEETYEGENRKDLEVDGSEAARDGHQPNITTTSVKDDTLHDSENGSTPNNATTEGSTDPLISNSTSTEVTLESKELPSDNATDSKPELGTEGTSAEGSDNKTVDPEQGSNSMLTVDSTHSNSNSTGSGETKDTGSLPEEFSDSSDNSTDSSVSDNSRSEASNEEGNNTTESSSEKKNEFDAEKSETSDGRDESLDSTSSDNAEEEAQEDAIDISDTSNSMEEKDIRMDLDTLPDIQTEGSNSEDVVAE
ncbi:dentin sialophosphoprotein-like [Salvia divinorum]|uniref:Dentin sialophosphoprotein-like n=1 Tax=Salvia divinorum TaxID=28513 RepID=A0ABD1I7V3_SALDI